MNCSRICLRRRLGRLSRGMAKRSRCGTPSPISCISPSTAHHSDFFMPTPAAGPRPGGGGLDQPVPPVTKPPRRCAHRRCVYKQRNIVSPLPPGLQARLWRPTAPWHASSQARQDRAGRRSWQQGCGRAEEGSWWSGLSVGASPAGGGGKPAGWAQCRP